MDKMKKSKKRKEDSKADKSLERIQQLVLLTRPLNEKKFPERVYLHSSSLKKLGVSIGCPVLLKSTENEKKCVGIAWRSASIFENRLFFSFILQKVIKNGKKRVR